MTAPKRIPTFVVVPAHTLLLDVAGPMEVLRKANQFQSAVAFDVTYVSPLPEVTSSIGLTLSGLAPLPDHLPPGALVIVSGDTDAVMPTGNLGAIEPARAGSDAIVTWLSQLAGADVQLVCICSGAMLAARAGLLDGRACTTHFADCARLAQLAPRAQVMDDRLFVEDGNCLTSAGITAGIDLMLHLVGRYTTPQIAAQIARHLVVYMRRDGHAAQVSPWFEGRNHLHPAIHRVQDAIAAEPAADWTLEKMADIGAASPRHLSRLFHQATGMTPIDFVNRLRVALARELLAQTRLDMERIAERSGFGSSRQLRRAWSRLYPEPPSAMRAGSLQ
ncbi:GlxA family transcriptional regulator [Devosia aquimaris]|uniref:GlxA family transcriptional regulator n=1 Tax=Devosia aquimaris TaxID=2866214 RepID=UPI001CD0F9E2|nr:helix-turn-helix domain-containing protein [Devosia sp. CJK-A8-3]